MEIPVTYLIWFQNKGFPKGELGDMLALTYEIKLNGLEYLINNLKWAELSSSKTESNRMSFRICLKFSFYSVLNKSDNPHPAHEWFLIAELLFPFYLMELLTKHYDKNEPYTSAKVNRDKIPKRFQ